MAAGVLALQVVQQFPEKPGMHRVAHSLVSDQHLCLVSDFCPGKTAEGYLVLAPPVVLDVDEPAGFLTGKYRSLLRSRMPGPPGPRARAGRQGATWSARPGSLPASPICAAGAGAAAAGVPTGARSPAAVLEGIADVPDRVLRAEGSTTDPFTKKITVPHPATVGNRLVQQRPILGRRRK
nr:hypothetical protein [Streptomyces sp. NWU339]